MFKVPLDAIIGTSSATQLMLFMPSAIHWFSTTLCSAYRAGARSERTLGSALLRQVAHGFDIVAVGIAHERTVVVSVILRPQAGLVKHSRA